MIAEESLTAKVVFFVHQYLTNDDNRRDIQLKEKKNKNIHFPDVCHSKSGEFVLILGDGLKVI